MVYMRRLKYGKKCATVNFLHAPRSVYRLTINILSKPTKASRLSYRATISWSIDEIEFGTVYERVTKSRIAYVCTDLRSMVCSIYEMNHGVRSISCEPIGMKSLVNYIQSIPYEPCVSQI